jgi:hypothetical protein
MSQRATTPVLAAAVVLTALPALLSGCNEDPVEPDLLIDGVVIVQPLPEGLQAPWTLTGPRGFERSSYGSQEYSVHFPGTYTVDWGDYEGWIAPPDSSRDLMGPGAATITGTYIEITGPAPADF